MKRIILLISAVILGNGIPAFSAQDDIAMSMQNTGFEEPSILGGAEEMGTPDGWFYFSSIEGKNTGITDRKKRNGLQSLKFKAQKKADAYVGVAQKISVLPGNRYEFSIYAVNDARDLIAGQAYGQVSLEWQDAEGKEISRNYGPIWNFELSPIRWEKFEVGAEAPEGAAMGVAVITFFSRDSDGYGTCYVDDAKFTRK